GRRAVRTRGRRRRAWGRARSVCRGRLDGASRPPSATSTAACGRGLKNSASALGSRDSDRALGSRDSDRALRSRDLCQLTPARAACYMTMRVTLIIRRTPMSHHPSAASPWLAASNVARVRRCACGGVELCIERLRLHVSEEELGELAD